jgi:hypothetical protein
MGRMPATEPQRLAAVRLAIDLLRAFHRSAYPPNPTEPPGVFGAFGKDIERLVVGACVSVGHLEGRPMSTSDVSAFIDLPRATTQRRMRELVERGFIFRKDDRFFLTAEALSHPAWARARSLILAASKA